jgi:membrane-bound inhibitor of C-type lysozyme
MWSTSGYFLLPIRSIILRFKNIFLVIGCFIFLLSCTNNYVNNKLIKQTYVYECNKGYNFTTSVENEAVWLFLPDQTIKLPHVLSSSGAKYSEGDKVFWNKGDEASLEIANEKYQGCINNQAKVVWEEAKLNGWDFRAVGNEPGWHLLVSKGKGIVFVTDYGQTTYKSTAPEPLINQAKKTATYHIHENGHALQLILKGIKCLDSMSEDSFETTVTVILDGKEFNGCGNALH